MLAYLSYTSTLGQSVGKFELLLWLVGPVVLCCDDDDDDDDGDDGGGGRDEGEGRGASVVEDIVGVDVGGLVVSIPGGTISTSSSSSFPSSPREETKVSDTAAVGSYIKFRRTCEVFALVPPLDPFIQLPSFTNLFRGIK